MCVVYTLYVCVCATCYRSMQCPTHLEAKITSTVKEQLPVGDVCATLASLFHLCLLIFSLPGLIGVRKYGVHVNGYYYTEGGEMVMWIGKRSAMKPKWPGLLDNIVRVTCHLYACACV